MQKLFILTLLYTFFIVLPACNHESPESENHPVANEGHLNNQEKDQTGLFPDYQIEIVEFQDGFGYEIHLDEKVLISQPHIPTIQGLHRFSSADDAIKTAEFVRQKLLNQEWPPSLSLHDLEKLDVLP